MSNQTSYIKILNSSGNIISVPKPTKSSKKIDAICPCCKMKTIHYDIIPDGKKQIFLFACLNGCESSMMSYIGNKEQAFTAYHSKNFILQHSKI